MHEFQISILTINTIEFTAPNNQSNSPLRTRAERFLCERGVPGVRLAGFRRTAPSEDVASRSAAKSAFRAPVGQTGDAGGRQRVAGGSASSGCVFPSNLSTERERVSYEKSGQVTWLGPEREVALGGEVP